MQGVAPLVLVDDQFRVELWPEVIVVGEAVKVTVGTGLVMVSVKLVVLVTPPPVPVTMIVDVPTGVVATVVMVRAEEQPGLQEAGLNEADAPAGRPEADGVTAWVLPDTKLNVMVDKADAPCVIFLLPSLASEKLKPVVTVRLKVLVLMTPPPVAVMVTVEVPIGVVGAAFSVNILKHAGEHEVGEKLVATPAGTPKTEKLTP